MKPNIVQLPDNIEIHLLENLLSETECADIISQYGENLEDVSHIYGRLRINSRCRFESDDLATTLWGRLAPFYKGLTRSFGDMQDYSYGEWKATHISNHFRLCKYTNGGRFAAHYDARKLLDPQTQTMLSLNIYLNTVSDDAGGGTRILSSNAKSTTKDCVVYEVRPKMGLGCVFGDTVLHDGDELKKDEKWLLRTDIIFQRPSYDLDNLPLDQQSKAFVAYEMAGDLKDFGNETAAAQWYKIAFSMDKQLEQAAAYITKANHMEQMGDMAGAIQLYKLAYKLCPKLKD